MQNVVNVGTAPVLIWTFPATGNYSLFIHSDRTNPPVFLGPSLSLTTSNGLSIGGGSQMNLYQNYGASVYACVAAGQYQVKWSAQAT
jgi:hypothetical protein